MSVPISEIPTLDENKLPIVPGTQHPHTHPSIHTDTDRHTDKQQKHKHNDNDSDDLSDDERNGEKLNADEQIITPWEVTANSSGEIDYNKLVRDFGSDLISEDLLKRIEKLTNGKPVHHWLRRGLFFSHRDFDLIL